MESGEGCTYGRNNRQTGGCMGRTWSRGLPVRIYEAFSKKAKKQTTK